LAFRIPSFADLPEVNPRPVGALPVYPAEDPVAAGLASFGKGVSAAGGALVGLGEARSKLNESNATLDLVNRLVPLHTQISLETDPAKIAELRKEYDTLLQTSGNAIDDPQRRQAWMATHAKTILQAHADADKRLTGLDRAQVAADGMARLDTAARNGAQSDDPNAVAGTLAEIKNNLDWQQTYGAITPAQRYEREKQATSQLIGGTVRRLMHQGRNTEALGILDANPDALDPSTHENLRNTIQTGRNKDTGLRAVDEALGLVAPQSRTSGGMQVGGAIGSRIAQTLSAC
jgi:hypothetical protein